MSIIRLADRLSRLEQRRNPTPDPRHLEEARERLLRGVLGLAATIEPGEESSDDFDLAATLTELVERRYRP
jgi:hypothetical protein